MDLGYNKKLILEDGSEYYGYGFGSDKEHVTAFDIAPAYLSDKSPEELRAEFL